MEANLPKTCSIWGKKNGFELPLPACNRDHQDDMKHLGDPKLNRLICLVTGIPGEGHTQGITITCLYLKVIHNSKSWIRLQNIDHVSNWHGWKWSTLSFKDEAHHPKSSENKPLPIFPSNLNFTCILFQPLQKRRSEQVVFLLLNRTFGPV